MKASLDPTRRFTGRAAYYARFRPGYPDAVIALLRAEAGWSERSVVADIGAGTGLSSELFLRHGNAVWAVEPNTGMRASLTRLCDQYPALRVVSGTAEDTTLPGACADFVVAATAYHWFDADRCRAEFLRILAPAGQVVLLWNKREGDTSPFLQAYEDLLVRYGIDYNERWKKDRHALDSRVSGFFGAAVFRSAVFENPQRLDLQGLIGRLLSSSYSPMPGDPDYDRMVAATSDLFTQFATDGTVLMNYKTRVYWGRPAAA